MSPAAATRRRAPAAAGKPRGAAGARAASRPAAAAAIPQGEEPKLPDGWREFVGRLLEAWGCAVRDAARGDWEVELSPELQRKWRRQRVRLVFDPLRATLPRGAWFMAPGSSAGRKLLDRALEPAMFTRRTALAHVPGAPEDGLAGLVKVRGLTWGPPRLGPVRYERRLSFHAVATRWGGMPWQEPWVVLLGGAGELLEWDRASALPEVRAREGLYQIADELDDARRREWMDLARRHVGRLLEEREQEWERQVSRLRDDELDRLGAFFSARIEEEEERLRRRAGTAHGPHHEESEIEGGDATSLKLEWERRAAEVRSRWAIRTEVRVWGLTEWSWPVLDLEQELRAGAMHVRLTSRVDVARGRPTPPACPTCGAPAEILVRARGGVACQRCA